MRYRGLMILTVVALAACNDDAQPAALVAPPAMTTTGVRAFVVREPGGTDEKVTLTIHIDNKGVGIAAYQGRLEFDAGAFDVIEANTPADGSRLVNAEMAKTGVIRFAGFSPEDFTKTAAVQLVVKLNKPLDAANLVATLDVAGEATGTAIAKDRMIVQRGIFTSVRGEKQ